MAFAGLVGSYFHLAACLAGSAFLPFGFAVSYQDLAACLGACLDDLAAAHFLGIAVHYAETHCLE